VVRAVYQISTHGTKLRFSVDVLLTLVSISQADSVPAPAAAAASAAPAPAELPPHIAHRIKIYDEMKAKQAAGVLSCSPRFGTLRSDMRFRASRGTKDCGKAS
jgi:hypothetical protein